MTHVLYLSLGTNLGNRLANLKNAISSLPPKVNPVLHSSIYESEPWGYSDQPLFLNQVIKANTELEPMLLLTYLKETEVRLGRQETFRFGPRLIDLDILFYDDLVINTLSLTIPHPRIAERAFILIPLAEIAPDFLHPVLGKSIQQLKTGVDSNSVEMYRSMEA
jgi:2-amino-4-hydroxy-6-hydroxymethyldihydropteridine diphosphokinase